MGWDATTGETSSGPWEPRPSDSDMFESPVKLDASLPLNPGDGFIFQGDSNEAAPVAQLRSRNFPASSSDNTGDSPVGRSVRFTGQRPNAVSEANAPSPESEPPLRRGTSMAIGSGRMRPSVEYLEKKLTMQKQEEGTDTPPKTIVAKRTGKRDNQKQPPLSEKLEDAALVLAESQIRPPYHKSKVRLTLTETAPPALPDEEETNYKFLHPFSHEDEDEASILESRRQVGRMVKSDERFKESSSWKKTDQDAVDSRTCGCPAGWGASLFLEMFGLPLTDS